jgi:hypothetical protein
MATELSEQGDACLSLNQRNRFVLFIVGSLIVRVYTDPSIGHSKKDIKD